MASDASEEDPALSQLKESLANGWKSVLSVHTLKEWHAPLKAAGMPSPIELLGGALADEDCADPALKTVLDQVSAQDPNSTLPRAAAARLAAFKSVINLARRNLASFETRLTTALLAPAPPPRARGRPASRGDDSDDDEETKALNAKERRERLYRERVQPLHSVFTLQNDGVPMDSHSRPSMEAATECILGSREKPPRLPPLEKTEWGYHEGDMTGSLDPDSRCAILSGFDNVVDTVELAYSFKTSDKPYQHFATDDRDKSFAIEDSSGQPVHVGSRPVPLRLLRRDVRRACEQADADGEQTRAVVRRIYGKIASHVNRNSWTLTRAVTEALAKPDILDVPPPVRCSPRRPASAGGPSGGKAAKSKPCYDFQRGTCYRGAACRFSHDGEAKANGKAKAPPPPTPPKKAIIKKRVRF